MMGSRLGALAGLCFLSATLLLPGTGLPSSHEAAPVMPQLRFPTGPFGYLPPGPIYTLLRLPFTTLNFLDANHLLFTFREPRLMTRDEHPAGEDQYVKVMVIELPSGREMASTEWRLHDRGSYLWPLNDGRVLVRQKDELFVMDASLKLRPLLHALAHLQVVRVSPDGRMLVIETDLERHTPEEHERLQRRSQTLGTLPPQEGVEIHMIELGERQFKLTAKAEQPGELPANIEGFVTQAQVKDDRWQLRFHTFGKPEPTAGDVVEEVASTCPPRTSFLNPTTLLVLNECPARSSDRQADAMALGGKKLWTGRWRSNFAWPTWAASVGGSDIAIAWLGISRSVATYDSFTDEEVQGQVIDVLDSKTGGLRLAVTVRPVASAGGNYALSPDGNRLAVLNRGMLEVYDVPAAPAPPPNAPPPK